MFQPHCLINDLFFICILLALSSNIHYIDFEGVEHYYTLRDSPPALEKKVKLLNYFRNYMKEHLLKAGANIMVREGDDFSRIPALKTWFRTSRAVVMHLTNGTLQVWSPLIWLIIHPSHFPPFSDTYFCFYIYLYLYWFNLETFLLIATQNFLFILIFSSFFSSFSFKLESAKIIKVRK